MDPDGTDARKAWEASYYKGKENEVLSPQIAERLASLGYIVEVVSVKHVTRGYGSTRGIGDLLVWRTSWGPVTGLWGLKVNLEVKTAHDAATSDEQKASRSLGGLKIVTTPDEAEAFMRTVEARLSSLLGFEIDTDTTGSVGLQRFIPPKGQTPRKKRTPKWLKECREAVTE